MAHYAMAANRNAQASFNLGYMYEHGIGSSQDFLLAKRYYDLAKEIHSDAYVPVTLALYKMSWHEALLPYRDVRCLADLRSDLTSLYRWSTTSSSRRWRRSLRKC